MFKEMEPKLKSSSVVKRYENNPVVCKDDVPYENLVVTVGNKLAPLFNPIVDSLRFLTKLADKLASLGGMEMCIRDRLFEFLVE